MEDTQYLIKFSEVQKGRTNGSSENNNCYKTDKKHGIAIKPW